MGSGLKSMADMKRWTKIFKALANINRLKIIRLLSDGPPRTVSYIAREIGISLNATSKHLILLHNLTVLEGRGREGHVFYTMDEEVPEDIVRAVDMFLKT